MKKKLVFSIIIAIFVSFALYYGYNLIKLNSVDVGEFSMEINLGDDAKHVGVFDGTLFYVKENKLIANSQKKGVLFEKNLGLAISDVVYDKYIYVGQKDGLIRAFDRFDGSLIRKINLGMEVFHMEILEDKLICYGGKKLCIVDLDLKDKVEKTFDNRPVKYSSDSFLESIIFLDREVEGLKSSFRIFKDGKEIYYISSVDELFMYSNFLLDGKCIVLTNSYLYLIENSKLVKKVFLLNPRAIDIKDSKIAVADDDTMKIYDDDLRLLEEVSLSFKADDLMFVKDKILLTGKNVIASFEDQNLIKTDVTDMKSYLLEKDGVYVIMPNRVEKVKAY